MSMLTALTDEQKKSLTQAAEMVQEGMEDFFKQLSDHRMVATPGFEDSIRAQFGQWNEHFVQYLDEPSANNAVLLQASTRKMQTCASSMASELFTLSLHALDGGEDQTKNSSFRHQLQRTLQIISDALKEIQHFCDQTHPRPGSAGQRLG